MPGRSTTPQGRSSSPGPGVRVELDVRTNSLNLIRLALAALVLVAHGFPLSGQGPGPGFRGENLGGWAVFGFFTISGYLITASRFANGFGRYLLLRACRIYPAFLVCLLVTAGIFAPLAWWADRGSLTGFAQAPTTPMGYVLGNALLKMTVYDVGGTPTSVPYPGAWNGSLWTLYFEALCYLIVGVLVCLTMVRRHRWLIGVAFAASVVGWANAETLHLAERADVELLARLLPPFLGGALVQTLARRVPLRASWALAAAAAAAGTVVFVDRWGAQAAAPLVTYAILWLSTVLPSPQLVRRHDISYGVYIYAFPVQQLLARAGVPGLGILAYDLAALTLTVGFGALSWRLVERPVMRWARRRGSGLPRRGSGLPPRGSGLRWRGSGAAERVPAQPPDRGPATSGDRPRQHRERVRP